MCGDHPHRPSRGGALAVLHSTTACITTSSALGGSRAAAGSLTFQPDDDDNGSAAGPLASRAVYTPAFMSSSPDALGHDDGADTENAGSDDDDGFDYVVGIHTTGNLLAPSTPSAPPQLLRRFPLRRGGSPTPLSPPLALAVGGVDGIIGRRVSVWRTKKTSSGSRCDSLSSSSSSSSSSSPASRSPHAGDDLMIEHGPPIAEGIVGFN